MLIIPKRRMFHKFIFKSCSCESPARKAFKAVVLLIAFDNASAEIPGSPIKCNPHTNDTDNIIMLTKKITNITPIEDAKYSPTPEINSFIIELGLSGSASVAASLTILNQPAINAVLISMSITSEIKRFIALPTLNEKAV